MHALGAAEFQSGEIGHAGGDIEIERIDALVAHEGLGAGNALEPLVDADRRRVAAHALEGGKLRLRGRSADTHRHEKPFLIVIAAVIVLVIAIVVVSAAAGAAPGCSRW